MLIQYPNAKNIIESLPTFWSIGFKCFKPEAHLLIKKFLSLKKETSRDLFIANMIEHTRVRSKVSRYSKYQRDTLFDPKPFSPLPFRPVPYVGPVQRMCVVESSGLVGDSNFRL